MPSSGGELRVLSTEQRHCCVADRTKVPRFARNDKIYEDRLLHRGLLGEEVVEGLYSGEFVFFDVKDSVELGDLKDVGDFLGKAEEFEFATGVADGGEATDEFSDAGGIDVVDVGEVENDFLFAGCQEFTNRIAELPGFIAEGDASVNVDDGDAADFASRDGHRIGVRLPGMLERSAAQVNGWGCS